MSRLLLLVAALSAYAQTLEPLGIALEGYKYPYEVRYLPLQIEGQDARMAYMDVAAKGTPNGRTAVLMHGKNFGGYYWANVADALSAAGYRVIVPDQIGWGKSTKPDIRYSFHLLAANTAKLLDTLNVRQAIIVGHSTGGILAVRFALVYPDRTTHLVLESPLGMEDYRVSPPQTDDEWYQAELNRKPDDLRALFQRYFVKAGPEVWQPLADVPLRVQLSAEYPRWAKSSALAYQMIYQQPVRSEYSSLKMPVLIIVGENDRTAIITPKASAELREKMGRHPELARAAAKEIPRATAIVVPECGHIAHLEYPEQFRKPVLDFLAAK